MRQETRTIYTAQELKENLPEAFEKAHRNFCSEQTTIPWDSELIDSLKGVFESAGIKLKDWAIDGICGHSVVKFEMDENVRELSGKRAFAWLENNLFFGLRIPFTPLSRKESKRRELAQYGAYYRAGMIKPCPFTGVCFDDDFIDALIEDIKSGGTLEMAFGHLAHKAGEIRAAEDEHQQTEDYFLDHADANEYEFDENGRRI